MRGTKDHQPLPDPQAGSSSRKTELPWAEYDNRKKRGGRRVGPCLEPAGLAHSRFGRPRGGPRGGGVLFSILLVLHVKLPHAGLGFHGKRPVALYPCVLPGALQRRGRGQHTGQAGKSELSPLPFHLPEHRGCDSVKIRQRERSGLLGAPKLVLASHVALEEECLNGAPKANQL